MLLFALCGRFYLTGKYAKIIKNMLQNIIKGGTKVSTMISLLCVIITG